MNELEFDGVRIREIPDYNGYWAGENGSIWSEKIKGSRSPDDKADELRRMTPWADKFGRLYVKLRGISGKRKNVAVAHCVLFAFIGPKPANQECCHENDNREDNRLVNLRWDTRAANQVDRIKNGRCATAKITEQIARQIKQLHRDGHGLAAIRELLDIPGQIVQQTINGRSWAHVKEDDTDAGSE